MGQGMISLVVFFEAPFWVGIFERSEGGKVKAARVVFGSEPKEAEVFEYVLANWPRLQFSPAVEGSVRRKADNPKRRQRRAARELAARGPSTKSQLALALQREAEKTERRRSQKQRSEEESERIFELRRQKRREKHRGH